ncbi:MAG: bifunctional DNA primase/polymerase [Candidatus Accumulibacter sp.]|nr:bifunctional DNA primase/polymerase [Accumulibacter sp.]
MVREAVTPLEFALRYASLGWHVFPAWNVAADGRCACKDLACKNPGKHPISYIVPKGQLQATTDEEKIKIWWSRSPDANIAVVMAQSGLCAIDIDPRNGGLLTMENIEARNGPLMSDVLAFTGGGGEHRVFQLPVGYQLPGKLGDGVDVKVNGYIIVEPSNHVSGHCYSWEASSDPLHGAVPSPLPDWIRDLASPAAKQDPASGGGRYVTDAQALELREALGYLLSDDYHAWINVGQALHSIGQQGFGLWDEWSKKSDSYDPVEMGRKWRSFKPGAFNYESIFKLAQDAGWVNPLSKATTARESELLALVAEGEKDRRYSVKEGEKKELSPFPVPMLDEVCSFICATQGIKHCTSVQMAAIALASAAASRNYSSSFGDGSHVYQLITAQTIGELRPLHNAVAQIVSNAGLRKILREQRFSSPASLFKTLMRSPATLYLSSDWGALAAFARRQPSGIVEQVLHLLANVFGQADILLDNPEELGIKAAAGVTNDMPVIRCPSLSMLAFASHGMLANSFSASEIGRGAVEQLIFHAGEIEPDGDPAPTEAPAWLVSHIQKVRRVPEIGTELDLASIFNGNAELIPTLVNVRFDAQPVEHYPAFDVLAAGNRQARPLILAARANLRRMAVALAAWGNPAEPFVSREILDWCARFVGERLAESLDALRLLGGSEDGKTTLYQAVLESITGAGCDGVTNSELVRVNYKFRGLPKLKREEVIGQLIEDGQVVETKGRQGNGKRLFAAQHVQEAAQ